MLFQATELNWDRYKSSAPSELDLLSKCPTVVARSTTVVRASALRDQITFEESEMNPSVLKTTNNLFSLY